MLDNPWRQLPHNAPYVLPVDEQKVRAFNATAKPEHYLHVDKILPEAFVGDPKAPVVLLSNNPGFNESEVRDKQDPGFTARMRRNLLHEPSEFPFAFLDRAWSGSGRKWWERKLRDLLGCCGLECLARSVLNVPYFPYPSHRYGHDRLRLPSQDYSFSLVREAMNRGAVIVSMRSPKRWLRNLPELEHYRRLFSVKNPQVASVSRRNCPGFDRVLEAIQARPSIQDSGAGGR